MSLIEGNIENQPHPASEEIDSHQIYFESEPTAERIPVKEGEMETRYIVRFEEEVFQWKNNETKNGNHVSGAEMHNIFNHFFKHLAENPIDSSEKSKEFSERLITRENLNLLIGQLRSNVHHGSDSDPYTKTTRGRNFFHPEPSNKPYVKTLFGMREDIFREKKDVSGESGIDQYISSKINGKRILNIGGHNMLKDFLTKGDLKPECVVNADPFITSEDIDMNKKGAYKSVAISASDENLERKLLEENVPNQYDEVWASFSVPLYLKTPDDISTFFSNVRKILAEKGTLRIFPLSLAVEEEGDFSVAEWSMSDYYKRKARFVEEILNLKSNDRFSVDVVSTYESLTGPVNALLIQRIK